MGTTTVKLKNEKNNKIDQHLSLSGVESNLFLFAFKKPEGAIKGNLGSLDWRLREIFSKQMVSGNLSGKLGEITLFSSSYSRMNLKILVLGTGNEDPKNAVITNNLPNDLTLKIKNLGFKHVLFFDHENLDQATKINLKKSLASENIILECIE